MRHRKQGLKLNRTSSHRDAMFRNMVTSLFKHERIRTTDAKAKELRRWADGMITLAKRGDLHARRQALSVIREKDVVHKLFEDAPERYGDMSGGYTRIVKLARRPGDAALISLIELVTPDKSQGRPTSKKKSDAAEDLSAQEEAAPEQGAESAGEDRAAQQAAEPAEDATDGSGDSAEGEAEENADEAGEGDPVDAPKGD